MSGRSKRRLQPPGFCDVPGCGQAIRFVQVMRLDPHAARQVQRWIAVNTKPIRPDDEHAPIASVFVVGGNVAVDVTEQDRDAAMQRAGFLYLEHKRVCFDPNWRRMRTAKEYEGRPGEN